MKCDFCQSDRETIVVPIRDTSGAVIIEKQICKVCADAVTTASFDAHVIQPAKKTA